VDGRLAAAVVAYAVSDKNGGYSKALAQAQSMCVYLHKTLEMALIQGKEEREKIGKGCGRACQHDILLWKI